MLGGEVGAIHAHNTSFDLLGENAYKDYMRTWDKVLAVHPDITWCPTTCNNLRLLPSENGLEHIPYLYDGGNVRIDCVDTGRTLFAMDVDKEGYLAGPEFGFNYAQVASQVRMFRERDIGMVFGVYKPGHLRHALHYVNRGLSPRGSMWDVYLIGDYGLTALEPIGSNGVKPSLESLSHYLHMIEEAKVRHPWYVSIWGQGALDDTGILRRANALGGHIKTGLALFYDPVRNPTNLQQAQEIARESGGPSPLSRRRGRYTTSDDDGCGSSASMAGREDSVQELSRPLLLGVPQHLRGRPALDHDAAVEEDDLVGHMAGKRHLVRGDEHRHPLATQLAHEVEHLTDELRVEGAGHLVEQEQPGLGRERTDDRHALLLTTRELVWVGSSPVSQPEALQQLQRSLVCVKTGHSVDPAGSQRDIGEHRQVREQVEGLEDDADPLPHPVDIDARVRDVLAVEQDLAVVDDLKNVGAPQQGGLPAARGADQDGGRPLRNREVDPAQHPRRAVPLPDAAQLEHRRRHGAPAVRCRA